MDPNEAYLRFCCCCFIYLQVFLKINSAKSRQINLQKDSSLIRELKNDIGFSEFRGFVVSWKHIAIYEGS